MMRIFFLLLTTLALFSCQNEHKDSPQTLNCYVRFDSDSNLFTAEAGFTDEKTRKAVEFPDGVTFQKMEMKPVAGYGMYQYEDYARFAPEPVFAWTDAQNNKQRYQSNIDSVSQISLGSRTISMSKAASLTWQGKALGKGETLLFVWQKADGGENQSLEVSSTNPLPVVDIPVEKLKKLSPGKWSLYLVRKKLLKDTVGQVKVNCISEYYSKPVELTVTR